MTTKNSDTQVERPLPFPAREEDEARRASSRKEISRSYDAVMRICACAGVPDGARNFIDALVSLSGGHLHIKANDFEIATVFHNDEGERQALKKKVQRWRKSLDAWQESTGITFVQIRSGRRSVGQDGEERYEKSEYRLVVLDMAAALLMAEDQSEQAVQSAIGLGAALPSRFDVPRPNRLTIGRCQNTAKSWAKKALLLAELDGEFDDVVREMQGDLEDLVSELKGGHGVGTNASRCATGGGTFLGTINTTSPYISSSRVPSNEVDGIEGTGVKLLDDPTGESLFSPSPDEPRLAMSQAAGVLPEVELSPLQHALLHAARGFRVFPVYRLKDGVCVCAKGKECEAPGKHPALMGWNNKATTNEETIRWWWRRFRNYNVGIATGEDDRLNLVVLDVDPKSNGEESLKRLIGEFGDIPPTLTAITGSGGRHFLFRAEQGTVFRNLQASTKLGAGLDIRASGGFIVAAGSTHASGARYLWENPNAEIAPIPEWLRSKLSPQVEPQLKQSTDRRNAIDSAARSSNPKGKIREHEGRNDFLFSKAIGLVHSGHTAGETLRRVEQWNDQKCEPPVSHSELLKIVDSAVRTAKKGSGGALNKSH